MFLSLSNFNFCALSPLFEDSLKTDRSVLFLGILLVFCGIIVLELELPVV